MSVGQVFPPEWRTDRDSQTGRVVTQLTNSPAEDYHPYFYNLAFTPDGGRVIFTSNKTGTSNISMTDWE